MSLKSKQYKAWLHHCAMVKQATEITATETAKEKAARIKKLLANYADFVNFYFPHYATVAPAPFHIEAANKIKRNKNLQAVFEWARGFAKSVTFTILIPLWLKARKDMKVMVLVGKSGDSANTLLSDLQAELESNQRYINDFGEQKSIGSWEEGNFSTQDGCAFFARGRGQSPRGLRKREFRPDYIVIDDLDDDQLVENPSRVTKMVDWIKEALFGALDMGKGRFIMVGNRIHKNSVLANIAQTKGIYHTKVNALDKKGEVSWKAKYTIDDINKAIAFMGWRRAQKEYFNNPIVEGSVFKKDWIKFKRISKQTYTHVIAYCDPSFKSSRTSDYKAIVVVGKTPKGHLHILDIFVRQCSIKEMVSWWYNLFEDYSERGITLQCWMEANFIQDTLIEEFRTEGEIRGFQLPIRGDKRKKPDKFGRIENISPYFERDFVRFSESIKNKKDTETAIEQLTAFEKGSNVNDDFPDSVEGAIWLLQRQARISDPKNAPSYVPRTRKNAY